VTRFLSAPGDRVLGIDEHAESVEFARRKFGSGGLDFEVRRAEDLSGVPGRFDAVVLADVLEHLDEPERMLDLSARLLRNGGAVLVSVPNGRGPFEVESWLNRLPGVGRASLKLLDYFVAFLNRFVFPGAWTRVVRPLAEMPYNVHSVHVQFFSKRRIVEMARRSGLELKGCANLSWLCGPYTNSLLAPSRAFCQWNTRVAEGLPAALVSAWFFEFRKP
jgi:2-polyprenyl-3-methyl-5-hydroxy-6-metoxy-1,4-benzoquinol methylase